MRTTDLTPRTLAALRARRPYPVVSITMPTHRGAADSAQDLVRLRNLIAEAKRRLEADPEVSREARIDVSDRIDRAAADIDWRYDTLDSLVLFAAKDENQVWYLPRSAPERVVLSDSFVTRNLVAARERTRPYWVLAVAGDHTTLWSGSDHTLQEARVEGFPLVPEPLAKDPERMEQTGEEPNPYDDAEVRRFLRQVDTALGSLLAAEPRPLYLVGLAPVLSLLEEVGSSAKTAVARVTKGGLTHGPASALTEALGPVFSERAERDVRHVAEQIEQAWKRRTFAAGLDEVWQAVREGRIGLLAVEENYRRTVRVTEAHLIPLEPEETPPTTEGLTVREDIVDEIIEAALNTDSEIVSVPDGTLAEHDHLAAVLRF